MSEIKPYPYQIRVGETLLSGKSVILQAPTGAGKTYAALMPFIHAKREDIDILFPVKCLYVVPMRVLAHQFFEKTEAYAKPYQRKFGRELKYAIQTGDQPDDKKFEGDLIFCTVDQFLSGFLTMPYGLPARLANINAGASVGSYLVLDEFHLLDPESTLPTVWHAIKKLSRLAPILLMTATFSATMLTSLAKEIEAEVVTVSAEESREIENREPTPMQRQRVWETSDEPLTAEKVLKAHAARSLVLCNTVHSAQTIYHDLQTFINDNNLPIQLLLLHSRFLTEDRRVIENRLRQLFGKGEGCDSSGSVIAIATQTIEVGVDITSEVLHTELAPASALIQRAGRCARYPGEQGKVIVYPVVSYLPYAHSKDSAGWGQEMTSAYEWLQANAGQSFDFAREQAFVDAVATPRDRRVLEGLFAGQAERKNAIQRVLQGDRQAADGRLLIRDADSCRILIHPDPDCLLDNPKAATGFNLQPMTVLGFFKKWQERAIALDLDWIAKILIEDDIKGDRSEENRTEYVWRSITDPNLLKTARTVVVNPMLAGYDAREGFLPDRGDTSFVSALPDHAEEQTWEGFSYQLESYEDHIQCVLLAYQRTAISEIQYPAAALENAVGWATGSVLEAAWLVCFLHDLGKLSAGWQSWARAHQSAVGRAVPLTFAAAHTDTDRSHSSLQAAVREVEKRYPKPHHAAEGAIAAAPVLFSALPKELAQAGVTAIARHHTPFACENQAFKLESLAGKHVAETCNLLPAALKKKIDVARILTQRTSDPTFSSLLVKPDQTWGWLAYTLLVRALRRADQLGTSYGTK